MKIFWQYIEALKITIDKRYISISAFFPPERCSVNPNILFHNDIYPILKWKWSSQSSLHYLGK